jgi:pimeloyl-ACP methyl ester carboxylesterase
MTSFLEQGVKEPAILFGHSLRGQVAILLAANYPHLVRGLIIGDASFDREKLRAVLLREQQRLLYWRELAGPLHSLEEISARLKQTPISVEGGQSL